MKLEMVSSMTWINNDFKIICISQQLCDFVCRRHFLVLFFLFGAFITVFSPEHDIGIWLCSTLLFSSVFVCANCNISSEIILCKSIYCAHYCCSHTISIFAFTSLQCRYVLRVQFFWGSIFGNLFAIYFRQFILKLILPLVGAVIKVIFLAIAFAFYLLRRLSW